MAIAHRYTRPDQYYISSDEGYGCPPYNSTPDALPPRPWKNQWPQYVDNEGWRLVEDHREREEPHFAAEDVQPGTEYWLPGDTHLSPARRMHTPGPLPDGALTERPAKTDTELLAETKAAKTTEITTGYDAAVAASLTMPTDNPTAQDITISAAAFAAEDAEGLAYIMQTHAARRGELLAAVEAAETAEEVQAIVVSYAV